MDLIILDDINLALIAQKTLTIFKYGAMIGFIVTSVLIINLNNRAFNSVFRERAKSYFWFFLLISIIPLLAFIYVFNAFFGKLGVVFAGFGN